MILLPFISKRTSTVALWSRPSVVSNNVQENWAALKISRPTWRIRVGGQKPKPRRKGTRTEKWSPCSKPRTNRSSTKSKRNSRRSTGSNSRWKSQWEKNLSKEQRTHSRSFNASPQPRRRPVSRMKQSTYFCWKEIKGRWTTLSDKMPSLDKNCSKFAK